MPCFHLLIRFNHSWIFHHVAGNPMFRSRICGVDSVYVAYYVLCGLTECNLYLFNLISTTELFNAFLIKHKTSTVASSKLHSRIITV